MRVEQSEKMPNIPGLTFRCFRGASDYPAMVAVIAASTEADQIEDATTVEDITYRFKHLSNCDPYQDVLLVEVADGVVGYGRGWWWDEPATGRIYSLNGFLRPEWRRKGIGRAMLQWLENRLKQIAASHPADVAKCFQNSAAHFAVGTAVLLERTGYRPFRYFYDMVRPSLDAIPDFPLPDGVEVRHALPEHYRAIYASVDETSKDEWPYSPLTEEDYQAWLANPHFQPHLWQVAWDVATGQPAGHVLTFIDEKENEKYGRKRGYTEGIGVERPWRRCGLARALIVRSLQAQKAAGMTESALAADSDSASGVTRLYESCGFQIVRRDTIYRKPF